MKYRILLGFHLSSLATPVGPSKYSKFDSDPEDEQEEKGDTKLLGAKDKTEMVVDSASGITLCVRHIKILFIIKAANKHHFCKQRNIISEVDFTNN